VKFKLDENLPLLVRQTLLSLGFDVHTVADEGLAGAPDQDVLKACVAEERVLITLDLDFSDIRAYPPGTHRGIWVLRPSKQTFHAVDDLVRGGIRLAAVERVAGQLWVIDEHRVRIRDIDEA
jgi:predicted nuclease of predicted toxin-antitoxin system